MLVWSSPDSSSHDPSCNDFHHGIAEFKCPYSKADVDPREACADASFYCSVIIVVDFVISVLSHLKMYLWNVYFLTNNGKRI